jgi:hypothetical protein
MLFSPLTFIVLFTMAVLIHVMLQNLKYLKMVMLHDRR